MAVHTISPNPWMIAPFIVLLGAIALCPLFAADWWSKHYSKVAVGLGLITASYYVFGLHAGERLIGVGHEYISFIILIGALFVVSGGIHINVKGEATPLANTAFLAIGAVASNLLGTTGASMLLIRPWLRMNKYRITGHHVVFFIFIVSNVGGCLTPIGDPPLFLGYLKGVPFWWVAEHCWPAWVIGLMTLLVIFYVLDCRNYRRAPKQVRADLAEPPDVWRFDGLWNLAWLAVILGAVFVNKPLFLREILMLGAAAASYFTTSRQVHEANHFNFHPIREVAILFIGIFATMVPALDWLSANAHQFASRNPTFFFWSTGTLSSFLDNAPTYLSFLSAAMGLFGDSAAQQTEVVSLLGDPAFSRTLAAISVGAVFFGACTYIGNGPNFMVKSIADHQKVHTPGFIKYIWWYTLPVMIPMLILVWFVLFRA